MSSQIITYILQIFQTTLRILQYAAEHNVHPEKAAYLLGEQMSLENNPEFPGRVQRITRGLVETCWHEGKDFWKDPWSLVGDLIV